jgi:hypothetical protein
MKHPKAPISTNDPNVDEIRAIRAELSAQFGNDVGRLFEHLREIEAEYQDRIVQPGRIPARKRRHTGPGNS